MARTIDIMPIRAMTMEMSIFDRCLESLILIDEKDGLRPDADLALRRNDQRLD